MAVDLSKIGKVLLNSVSSGESVLAETLWKDQRCVMVFLRRFGCQVCRLYARQLSALKPQLDSHNVRFIAIGMDEMDAKEFVSGKYFDGEVYIDTKREAYNGLGYKRIGFFRLLRNAIGKSGREALSLAKKEGIPGTIRGDILQTGGCLIVSAGGKDVLLNYVQGIDADIARPEDILKALEINEPVRGAAEQSEGFQGDNPECDDGMCDFKS